MRNFTIEPILLVFLFGASCIVKKTSNDEKGNESLISEHYIEVNSQRNFSEHSWEAYGMGAFLHAAGEIIKLKP